jgi:hypothetical protein
LHYESVKQLLPKAVATQRNTVMVEKAMRDARLLKEHARLVIVLDYDEGGNAQCRDVIDNSMHYVADVIAVLAPVRLFDNTFILDQGLVLEIGMSRGRPYRQAETWEHPNYPGVKLCIKGRRKLRETTLQELQAAWPHIETHLRIRTERRMSERKQNTFAIHGGKYVHEDGVRITVAKNDSIAYYKVVLEDARARQERYLRTRVGWIAEKLRPYRSSKSKATGKRFKRLKGVREVADAIKNMRRLTYAPNHIMRTLSKSVPKDVKVLFEDTLRAHGLGKLADAVGREPVMPPALTLAKQLPVLDPGRFWIVRKQGIQPQNRGSHRRQLRTAALTKQAPHAQGCVVVEYYIPTVPI